MAMLESVQLAVSIELVDTEFGAPIEAAQRQSSELFPRIEELSGLVRDLPAAMSPIHPGRQKVDSADGKAVQPELDPSSAVERPQVEVAVQSVKKTDDSQLQQPAPDGDMPLVIHAASDIESDVDDAVRQASAPKTEVVVRGGTG